MNFLRIGTADAKLQISTLPAFTHAHTLVSRTSFLPPPHARVRMKIYIDRLEQVGEERGASAKDGEGMYVAMGWVALIYH